MTAPVLADVSDPGVAALHASTFTLNNGFGIEPQVFKKSDGSGTQYKGVAVFRSGTFRDSSGMQSTWESIHLNQMVSNWEHLRDNNTFKDVPVRDGHPGWLINGTPGTGKVVGWHTNLRVEKLTAPHDGQEYDYLLADYDILDPEAQANIESKLWRNRSSEVGTYTTNSESEHWPVYMGVAYVDIPAVEGLNFRTSETGRTAPKIYVMFDNSKEKDVTAPVLAVPAVTAQVPAVTPQVPAVQPPAQHAAPVAPTAPAFVFTMGGQPTSDFAAVQARLTVLEAFHAETTKANRENFIKGLCAANRLPVTQEAEYIAYAQSLDSTGYEAFAKLYGDVPVPALLGQHGVDGGVANGGQPPAAASGAATEAVILREQVGMHKAAGTQKATIEKMDSYKRLIALDPAFKL